MRREPIGGHIEYRPGEYHHTNGWAFFADGPGKVAAVSPRKVYYYRTWEPFRETYVWRESSGFMPGHSGESVPRGAGAGLKAYEKLYRV